MRREEPGDPGRDVRLRAWAEDDLETLRHLNSPETTAHLGGPETEEKVLDRHRKYLAMDDPAEGRMFTVRLGPADTAVGSVGYWSREWRGEQVYEAGWGVLPRFQGRGLAVRATRLLVEEVRSAGLHRPLHAFPSVDHGASNGVCRGAGFSLLGTYDFEYPPGRSIRCNDWCLEPAGAVPAPQAAPPHEV